jgi:geranylgeranyl diphosphate synthase, type II
MDIRTRNSTHSRPLEMGEDELKSLARGFRDAVAARLDALIPAEDTPPLDLHRSMRHTLMAPGKKVRALLTLFVARHVGAGESVAVSSACALEMVHAASLILDDLPAMDNASLRRGLPANHQLFGDATAILAAIGLLSRGFGVLAEDDSLPSEARVRLSDILSRAVGSEGLIAGQELDLKWSAQGATRQDVALIHARKTAALFAAAAEMGAVAGAADDDHAACLRQFGMKLGLAFQILDDLLDATGTEASTGKNVAQDEGRPSLVLTIGQAAAQREAALLIEEALALIPEPGRGDGALRQFAMWLIAGLEAKLRVAGC